MACYEYIMKNGQEQEIGECYRVMFIERWVIEFVYE